MQECELQKDCETLSTEANNVAQGLVPEHEFTPRYKCLSGSVLKTIAILSMLIDHVGAFIVNFYECAHQTWFELFGIPVTLHYLMRSIIGRAAFPIFCFLLAEGFVHTRNRLKYGIRLLIFAFISEIPYNLAFSWKVRCPEFQNVFFTLFLGYLALCAMEYLKRKPFLQLMAFSVIVIIVLKLKADYSIAGFALVLVMYYMRGQTLPQAIAGTFLLPEQKPMILAFIPIGLYNGKRGYIQGKASQYAFYLFYPLHLLLIFLCAKYMLHLCPEYGENGWNTWNGHGWGWNTPSWNDQNWGDWNSQWWDGQNWNNSDWEQNWGQDWGQTSQFNDQNGQEWNDSYWDQN